METQCSHVKVLLIENNPEDARRIKKELLAVKSTKFDLLLADCLSQGLKHLAEANIDIVLLDLSLPDSNGIDTFLRITQQKPDIPVVILTAHDDESFAINALRQGAQDSLIKEQVYGTLLARSLQYAIERNRIKEALFHRGQEFRKLVENTPDIIARFDRELRFVYINPAIQALTGIPPQNFIGKTHRQVGVPDDGSFLVSQETLRKVFKGGHKETCGFTWHAAGTKHFQSRIVPEFTINGSIESILVITRDITDLKLATVTAENAFLQAQIKPHFLFNVLNTIASLTETDPTMAGKLLIELGNFLRHSFDFNSANRLIAVEKEIDHVRSYLTIEKLRFQERLRVVFTLDQRAFQQKIPPFVLQPLVENAVRHGLLPKEDGGTITISLTQDSTNLTIVVEDNGVGIPPEKLPLLLDPGCPRSGVALKNIQHRLQNIDGSGLKLYSVVGEGTRVTITIPRTEG